MTKIERAEKAVLRLDQEGLLVEGFEITSMRLTPTHALMIYGKANNTYYRWIERAISKDSFGVGKKLWCCYFIESSFANPQWDEEDKEVKYMGGLQEHEYNSADIFITDEGEFLTVREYIERG